MWSYASILDYMTCFYKIISLCKWAVVFAMYLDKLALCEYFCRFCNFYGRCIISMVTTYKQTNDTHFVRVDALPVTGQIMTICGPLKSVPVKWCLKCSVKMFLMFNIYVAVIISSMFWYDMSWHSWCLMQCIKHYCSLLHYCSILYFIVWHGIMIEMLVRVF